MKGFFAVVFVFAAVYYALFVQDEPFSAAEVDAELFCSEKIADSQTNERIGKWRRRVGDIAGTKEWRFASLHTEENFVAVALAR